MITFTIEWQPYHYEDKTSKDKPRNYQSVIFVSDTINGKPAVYSGYYDESQRHFISYQEDFRFNGAEVQYWMPLPKPPGENYDMD